VKRTLTRVKQTYCKLDRHVIRVVFVFVRVLSAPICRRKKKKILTLSRDIDVSILRHMLICSYLAAYLKKLDIRKRT